MKKYAIWVCIGVSLAVMQTAAQAPQTKSNSPAQGGTLRAGKKEDSLASVTKPAARVKVAALRMGSEV